MNTSIAHMTVISVKYYEQQHRIPTRFEGNGVSAANIAVSNVSLRFSCVNEEHSMYAYAPYSFAARSPCSRVIGFCLDFANNSTSGRFVRRSVFVPTRRNGVARDDDEEDVD